MKISLARAQLTYPGCVVNGVQEFYHPDGKWTSHFKNGVKVISSGLSPEEQVKKALEEGALIIQLQVQHEGVIRCPDYKAVELQEAL